MHPEILRELTAQRGREMRARAHQDRLARIAIRVGRRRPNRPDQADRFVLPAVPDYVDGSFRTEPTGKAVASEPAGEAVASEPAGEAVASEPTGEAVASEAAGEAVASEATGEAVASEAGQAPATHHAA